MIQALLLLSMCAQDDQAVVDALLKFKTSYKGPSAVARAAAVTELSNTKHEKTFSRLASLLMGEAKEVRIAAINGLASFTDLKRKVTPTLLNTLSATAKEPEVSAAILTALGKLKDETALPSVIARFRKEHITIAKAALAAAATIGTGEALRSLNEYSQDIQKWEKAGSGGGYYDDAGVGEAAAQTARVTALKAELIKAFQTISGEQWTTLQEWEVWFRRHKDDPKFAPRK
jgi:HEAT repeat protein